MAEDQWVLRSVVYKLTKTTKWVERFSKYQLSEVEDDNEILIF